MAIKTISQFDAATPASNDKILFEQNGEGKSATLANLPISTKAQTALDAKVNTANVLTLEEIQATTDLTGKVASAKSAQDINSYLKNVSRKVFRGSSSGTTATFGTYAYIDHLGIFSWHDKKNDKGGVIIVACGYSFDVIVKQHHNGGDSNISGFIDSVTVTTNSDNGFNWQYTVIGDVRG